MRYIALWELDAENYDRVCKLTIAMEKDETEYPEKYPKIIVPPHAYIDGHNHGFTIVEGTHAQLRRMSLTVVPEIKITYLPIIEVDS